MESSSVDRSNLEKDLANLLEYDDVIEEIPEILDNLLLSFFPDVGNNKNSNKNANKTSRDDLLEHMVAWLGNGGDAVLSFVENVVRFKNGERTHKSNSVGKNFPEERKVEAGGSGRGTNATSNPQPTAGLQETTYLAKANRDHNNQKQREARQKKERLQKQNQQEQERKQKVKIENEKRQRQQRLEEDRRKQKQEREEQIATKKRRQEIERAEEAEASALAKRQEIQKKRDSTPRTGQATFICGCFGTKCKPLTNCLHCGRIACEKEGYGYCPFCSYLIEDISIQQIILEGVATPGSAMEKAILHKERLLEFDRECAKRTVVLDDQADYFKNSSSTWLSGDERQRASEQDNMQRKELHDRKKVVMKLDILG